MLSNEILEKVTWCGLKANYYICGEKEPCSTDVLTHFAKTAPIWSIDELDFFRGKMNGDFLDLYDVQYLF